MHFKIDVGIPISFIRPDHVDHQSKQVLVGFKGNRLQLKGSSSMLTICKLLFFIFLFFMSIVAFLIKSYATLFYLRKIVHAYV